MTEQSETRTKYPWFPVLALASVCPVIFGMAWLAMPSIRNGELAKLLAFTALSWVIVSVFLGFVRQQMRGRTHV